jgi:hypothetical protein
MSMRQRRTSRRAGIVAAVAAMALVGCDLTVTNPGPVQDSFLDEEGAYPAVLQGVRRQHGQAFTRLAVDAAMMSFEGIPGGLFDTDFVLGTMTSDNSSGNWDGMQQARWVAEDGARRLQAAGGGSGPVYAEILLHAAYANRSLGHNMCTFVVDGGPPSDFMDYFDRAEDYFDMAEAAAAGDADLVAAARAGRADVKMWQGDWAGAVANASSITDEDQVFQVFFDAQDYINGANEMYFRQAALPWREYTIESTFMEGYYEDTGDPRMAWRTNPSDPITMVYNLPFYVQLKFTEPTAPHTFSSYWETRLILAEDILVNDPANYMDAVDLINEVRTRNVSDDTGALMAGYTAGSPLPAYTAAAITSVEDAWVALKQERRVELWGENRRFGDLRRWSMEGRPGDQPMEDMSGRSSCFPVGTSEVNTNQNSITPVTTSNSPRFP